MISLRQLLTRGHPLTQQVCVEPSMTWEGLGRATAHLCAQLPKASHAPWLVAVDSNYHFAAALLACWQLGIPAMLSADTQPGTLELLRSGIGGCITDHAISLDGVPVVRAEGPQAAAFQEWIEPRPDAVAVELFTSGTTGQRRRVPKTFAQLDNELAAWEKVWPDEPSGQQVLATVSHFHIYGLLFGVLRPLCRGDVIHGRNHFFWEELLARLPGIVVSSPVHLRHLSKVAQTTPHDWSKVRLLCSGGPLAEDAAAEIVACCGQGAVEIYGSTETGGIAFRQQTWAGRPPWRALPGVSTRVEDGLLAVRSAWLPDENWLLTGDKAALDEAGRFVLQGRADRIAKILEKRVSLAEMEARLAGHPYVSAARVLPLPQAQEAQRDMLGAVLELTGQGSAQLSEHGTAAFENEIRQHLRRHFDPIVLPRRWRTVAQLPVDGLGKVTHESLVKLFACP